MRGSMALKFSVNLSMHFTDVPFIERFGGAARAGFSAVEFLSPYEDGARAVREQVDRLGLTVALFNLHLGETEKGEWGALSNPDRREYFRWSFTTALQAARELDCPRLNTMFGQRNERYELQAQIDCACENLAWAAPLAADAGVDLLIEPLNPVNFPKYALSRTLAAVEIIRRVAHPRVGLLYDVYHAQMIEGNLIDTITQNFEWIRHVQIADVPGRHQPGTGEINYPAVFAALERLGYSGYIGLEYRPLGDSESSFAWMTEYSLKV
jgi:hydroxypyruvate isomerase